MAFASAGGASGRRERSGRGVSETCFTSIAGVLDALNGVSPASIWYPITPSE